MPLSSLHYVRMRRQLTLPIAPSTLPDGVMLIPFTAEAAMACRALMKRVYVEGLGDGGISYDGWWKWLTADPEYDPELMWVAMADRTVIGFCHCWREAFIKNLVVDAAFRERGLGTALLTKALLAFKARGAAFVELKTELDNVKAQSLYQRLGFSIVERLD